MPHGILSGLRAPATSCQARSSLPGQGRARHRLAQWREKIGGLTGSVARHGLFTSTGLHQEQTRKNDIAVPAPHCHPGLAVFNAATLPSALARLRLCPFARHDPRWPPG